MSLPQYFKIYRDRLRILRESFTNHKFSKFTEIGTTTCDILGILFMVSDLKPSIFDDLKHKECVKGSYYYSKDVKWFLEDENDKIELINLPHDLILSSGMVLAITGRIGKKGIFIVDKVHFPDTLKKKNKVCKPENYRILMIGCLHINTDKKLVKFQEQLKYVIKNYEIQKLIMLGSIFHERKCSFAKSLESFLKKFNVEIITVPGPQDPTSCLHPQEAIHSRILDFKNIENPGFIEINNRTFLISSGSCVEDLLKYKQNDLCNLQQDQTDYKMHLTKIDEVEQEPDLSLFFKGMETVLKCRITCPSAPDTLHAHSDVNDGFVIQKEIDYFISGSGPRFGLRTLRDGVKLVSVPNYDKTGQFIIYNLMNDENKIVQLD